MEEVQEPVLDAPILDPEFADPIPEQVRVRSAKPMALCPQTLQRFQTLDPGMLRQLFEPIVQGHSSGSLPVEHHVRHVRPAWHSLAKLINHPKPFFRTSATLPARGLGPL
jgi:hypothetical protein